MFEITIDNHFDEDTFEFSSRLKTRNYGQIYHNHSYFSLLFWTLHNFLELWNYAQLYFLYCDSSRLFGTQILWFLSFGSLQIFNLMWSGKLWLYMSNGFGIVLFTSDTAGNPEAYSKNSFLHWFHQNYFESQQVNKNIILKNTALMLFYWLAMAINKQVLNKAFLTFKWCFLALPASK